MKSIDLLLEYKQIIEEHPKYNKDAKLMIEKYMKDIKNKEDIGIELLA